MRGHLNQSNIPLCGYPTKNGPCNMPKDHQARFHRHRIYNRVEWILRVERSDFELRGAGINELNAAIAKSRVVGSRLLIEVVCA